MEPHHTPTQEVIPRIVKVILERLLWLPGSSPGQWCGRERDPAGDQPAPEGQWDLLARGECRGDAGAACGGVDGSMGGDDGADACVDGAGSPPRLAMDGPRHGGGVEVGCGDQATDGAT